MASRAALSLWRIALLIVAAATVETAARFPGAEGECDRWSPGLREAAVMMAADGTWSLPTGLPMPVAWRGSIVMVLAWTACACAPAYPAKLVGCVSSP